MRIAIFGGTFDPIHNAHIRVAQEAADQMSLDRVLFVPAGRPPHKPEGLATDYRHRLRMVELACPADPRFVASDIESGGAVSYSIDTIQKVRASLQPDDELFFLIGADAFAEIGSWHRSAEVLGLVEFIVVSRPGYDCPAPAAARVHRLESLALPVSSSGIREKLDAGLPPDELPPPVLDYIRREGLYR